MFDRGAPFAFCSARSPHPAAVPRPAAPRRPPAAAPAEPTPPALLRRVPQQDRGQRRVDLLLDAAAEVIGEVGVDAASTNAIAARARTSVGSLYQFFPNREAIVHALAARYTAAFERLKERAMALEVADRPLPEMMRAIIAPIAAFCVDNPAYPYVYAATADRSTGRPSAEEARLHAAVVERVEALIARRTPWVEAAQRHATAVVQVETVHAVLFHANTLAAAERPRIADELVRMLVCALEPFDRARPAARPAKRAGAGRAAR